MIGYLVGFKNNLNNSIESSVCNGIYQNYSRYCVIPKKNFCKSPHNLPNNTLLEFWVKALNFDGVSENEINSTWNLNPPYFKHDYAVPQYQPSIVYNRTYFANVTFYVHHVYDLECIPE